MHAAAPTPAFTHRFLCTLLYGWKCTCMTKKATDAKSAVAMRASVPSGTLSSADDSSSFFTRSTTSHMRATSLSSR